MDPLSLIHHPCVQGSEEWLALRLGKLTASRAAAAMMRGKPRKDGTPGAYLEARRHLATALALERITGRPAYERPFQTDAMARGQELEPLARAAYSERTGTALYETGIWLHPEAPIGASFDGLSLDDTVAVECKALYPSNHLDIALAAHEGAGLDAIPEKYRWQVTHLMAWMPSLRRVDFVAYCPEMPAPSDLMVIPVLRDDGVLSEYREQVEVFLAEVTDVEGKIRQLGLDTPPEQG